MLRIVGGGGNDPRRCSGALRRARYDKLDSGIFFRQPPAHDGGVPIAAPFVDLTTIGAGGGSIAWIDKGGFLRVGPQSAGADPGPVCYDHGGHDVTVTDANLVLGRLNPDYFLAGKMKLNSEKAGKKLAELGTKLNMNAEETAQAVIEMANDFDGRHASAQPFTGDIPNNRTVASWIAFGGN